MTNRFNLSHRTRRHFVTILLSCSAVTTAASWAQKPMPVPSDGLKSARRAAPELLKGLGADSFEMTVTQTGAVQIALFDGSSAPVGTATFVEEARGSRFRYSFRNVRGREVFVTVDVRTANEQVTVTSKSSNGRTLTLVADQDSAKKPAGDKAAIKRVRANDGGRWRDFTAAELQWRPPDVADVNPGPAAALEDEVLFTTDDLKLLRASLRSFTTLQQSAFGRSAARIERGAGVQAVAYRVVAAQSDCKALCFRIATLAPLYVCDDGYWNGCYCPYSSGFWWIGECGYYIWCNVACLDFCMNQSCPA